MEHADAASDARQNGAARSDESALTVASVIADELCAVGVDTVFGLVGEDTVALMATLVAAGVRYVGTRHEAGAVGMADGYSWAADRLGVCTVTRGPGLTNAMTALRTAVQGHRSLLVLTGDVPVDGGGPFYKNIDQGPLCCSVGLEYFPVGDQRELRGRLRGAVEAAAAGRPAVLAVAADVLAGPFDGPDGSVLGPPQAPRRVPPRGSDVDAAATLLAAARRPLLLAGAGASAGCRLVLAQLAERTGALLGTTLLAKGAFRGNPYDVGVVGGYAKDPAVPVLADIDLVMAFGASLSPYTTAHGTLFRNRPIVQVDRSAERIGVRTPVTIGAVADAELFARRLLAAVAPLASGVDGPLHAAELLRSLRGPASAQPAASRPNELDPREIAVALDRALPADRVLVFDSGRFSTAPGRFVDAFGDRPVRHTAEGGSIGLGLGVALGAACARPERTTVLFAGDGGFSMALADLETAARHHLGLIVVVMDDRAYGSELSHLRSAGRPPDLALLSAIDFAAVARALGIEAITVRRSAQLADLGLQLHERREPLVIHCLIARDLVVPRIVWPVSETH